MNRPGFRLAREALLAGLLAALLAGPSGGCRSGPTGPESLGSPASDAASVPARAKAATADAAAEPATERIGDETARPPYYRIDGGRGAQLLLMGTIHLGPRGGWRFSDAIRQGWSEADAFALEIDPRTVGEAEVASVLAERVVLPPGETILDRVSPETAKLLDEREDALSALGLPAGARRRLEPWYIAMGLLEGATSRSGYPMARSADAAIYAARGERPLVGLERFEEQLAMLDALPPTLQDALLRDTLERLDELIAELETLMRAWAEQDEATLLEIAYLGADESPELAAFYEILLDARNRRWAERLAEWLDDPSRRGETIFVGVGALHLVGPHSLVRLLREADYRVTPIDQGSG